MDKPQQPTIAATDPRLIAEQQQAQADQVRALQTQAQGDTASLMARYGTRLALASATGTGGGTPFMTGAALATAGAKVA